MPHLSCPPWLICGVHKTRLANELPLREGSAWVDHEVVPRVEIVDFAIAADCTVSKQEVYERIPLWEKQTHIFFTFRLQFFSKDSKASSLLSWMSIRKKKFKMYTWSETRGADALADSAPWISHPVCSEAARLRLWAEVEPEAMSWVMWVFGEKSTQERENTMMTGISLRVEILKLREYEAMKWTIECIAIISSFMYSTNHTWPKVLLQASQLTVDLRMVTRINI